jgi:hypothetical protein
MKTSARGRVVTIASSSQCFSVGSVTIPTRSDRLVRYSLRSKKLLKARSVTVVCNMTILHTRLSNISRLRCVWPGVESGRRQVKEKSSMSRITVPASSRAAS